MPDYESRLGILRATLRKSPVSKDVDLSYIARETNKFSGADLSEICMQACKLAIREDIEHDVHATSESEDEEMGEFLPELLPRHFEEAVRNARRSVSDRDLAHYQSFAKYLQRGASHTGTGLTSFTFPATTSENIERVEVMDEDDSDDDLYS